MQTSSCEFILHTRNITHICTYTERLPQAPIFPSNLLGVILGAELEVKLTVQPQLAFRECKGSWGVKLLARAVYQLHRLHQRLRRALGPHPLLLWPLTRCIAIGSQHLSKRLLLACEVAMELMLSLTYAHQVQWLQRHRPSHPLLAEVHEQSQKVG